MLDKSNTHNHTQKKALWRARLTKAAEYCGSEREFCKTEGISIHTFYYWKYKFEGESKNQGLTIQPFAKIQIKKSHFETPPSRAFPDPQWLAEFILHLRKGMHQ